MADLLSASEWLEIRGAIQDVTETFFDLPVVVKMRNAQNKLTPYNDKRDTVTPPVSYNFLCLNVIKHSDDGDKAKATQMQSGFMDDANGFVLVRYVDIKNNVPSLIDAGGLCTIKPNRDNMTLLGEDVNILGVNLVGPTETDYQLVKIHYKKDFKV